jgi:FkbM family methyltransferase
LTPLLRRIPATLPGKARFARLALGRSLDDTDVTVTTRDGLALRVPSLRESIGFHLLIDGVYEPETMSCLEQQLPRGGTFVDVGANIGVFTCRAASIVGPSGRVLAIEASPAIRPYLEENVGANCAGNVVVEPCAAADVDGGDVDFFEAPRTSFGMGSLAPQFSGTATRVPGRTLDAMLAGRGIDHVDVLKVDVEGFEASVFRGARRLLAGERPPLVIFEFLDWADERATPGRVGAAQQVLFDAGYTLCRLEDFIHGRPAIREPLRQGGAMLVARSVRRGGRLTTCDGW